jgi:hypothetical protein
MCGQSLILDCYLIDNSNQVGDGRLKQGCNPPLWGNAGPRLGVGKHRVGRREGIINSPEKRKTKKQPKGSRDERGK